MSNSEKNKLTANSGAFKEVTIMLLRGTSQLEAKRIACPADAALRVYRCESTGRGSSSMATIAGGFAPVAQLHNLDWLGPGS